MDIELTQPISSIEDLDGYKRLMALVRMHGSPIGSINVPVANARCSAGALKKAILARLWEDIIRHLLADGLMIEREFGRFELDALFQGIHPPAYGPLPSVTVAICTRDRGFLLKQCLDSLSILDYPSLETIVIDNAPSDESTKEIVQQYYPNIRYIEEPRPGLNWARNRAILEARGEIIAFTDDDCVVDSGWVKALVMVFAENTEAMAVTGLVFPYELETEAQILFERSGGFGRGFSRKWCRIDAANGRHVAREHGGTGKFGTGANMAYRLNLFNHIGLFDPALDVGTPTGGGGDLEMFFRVIKEGYTLVYEPNALVRHIHRRETSELYSQMKGWGTGLYSHFAKSALAYPKEFTGFVRFGVRWLWERNIRRLLVSLFRPSKGDRSLILAELLGGLTGVFCYLRSRLATAEITKKFGHLKSATPTAFQCPGNQCEKQKDGIGIRFIDLAQPLEVLSDVTNYPSTRIFVEQKGRLLGYTDIGNQYQSISIMRLRDAIVSTFKLRLLETSQADSAEIIKGEALAELKQLILAADEHPEGQTHDKLSLDISVSVVVATYDRPEHLRNCIECLFAQKTQRKVEIIVVDNHPDSYLTSPVLDEFPGVVLVNESRQGLSYARNAGILASKGKIIITTDDDVTMPCDWLERIIAPFARHDVMIVTGNVLPVELETPVERLFETYGGLGRGFERFEADRKWFESFGRRAAPTWSLGCTANAAFRSSVFSDPEIGLLDEALGPGTPTGVGEDTYLFYKVLKAGYTIFYEPAAYVWHKHRSKKEDFYSQIYNYSKGHVAYHLTTLIRDHDLRAILRLVWELPRYHVRRIVQWILGNRAYPLGLILREVGGNLAGPWALWLSCRRVRRDGRSDQYLPKQENPHEPRLNVLHNKSTLLKEQVIDDNS